MNKLYPLKFKPILKDKIWGGQRLKKILNKKEASDIAGESWEISGYTGNISVVSNGFLKGNDLSELIEVYMGDLVGDKIFDRFGLEFPLLLKFIDANDILSIQVHPDDEIAFQKHGLNGKTEIWYIIDAEKDADLISGFNQTLDRKSFLSILESGKINEVLNRIKVKPGDVFFLPAGRVHTVSAGVLLAEIQQTSDLTYRIYDWDRKDESGKSRDLHIESALDAIDYTLTKQPGTKYPVVVNKSVNIVECQYFTVNVINLDESVEKDFNLIDSFVIYMCTNGKIEIQYNGNEKTGLSKGETVLIPAIIKEILIIPFEPSTLLEVYIS